MSVVNQMLRDLDRRQVEVGSAAFTEHMRPVAAAHRSRWLALTAGIVIAGGAALVIAQSPERKTAQPPSPIAAAATAEPGRAAVPIESLQPVRPPHADVPSAPLQSEAAGSGVGREQKVAPHVALATPPVQAMNSAGLPEPRAAKRAQADVRQPLEGPSQARELTSPPLQGGAEPRSGEARPREQAAPAPAPAERAAGSKDRPESRTAPDRSKDSATNRTDQHAKAAPAAVSSVPPSIDKRFTAAPASLAAETAFRRSIVAIDKGRIEEAILSLTTALDADADHTTARQTLAALLLEARRLDEAERVLAVGLSRDPRQANFALVLGRLRFERGDRTGALDLMQRYRAAATGNAQFHGFLATLFQRAGQHAEAIPEFQAALRLAPNVGIWWIGLGLSQEATERTVDAQAAFQRARASGPLAAPLEDLVERKLQTLQAGSEGGDRPRF